MHYTQHERGERMQLQATAAKLTLRIPQYLLMRILAAFDPALNLCTIEIVVGHIRLFSSMGVHADRHRATNDCSDH